MWAGNLEGEAHQVTAPSHQKRIVATIPTAVSDAHGGNTAGATSATTAPPSP